MGSSTSKGLHSADKELIVLCFFKLLHRKIAAQRDSFRRRFAAPSSAIGFIMLG
jgi:hypothetical protein